MPRSFIFFALMSFFSLQLYAQNIEQQLRQLKKQTDVITSETPDFEKYAANEKLLQLLNEIFNSEKYFDFPFDSLKKLSVQISPDKKFKLITWGIAKENGEFDYFGYILHNPKEDYPKYFIPMTDKTAEFISPSTEVTDHKKWFGAIYYKIIFTHYQGKKVYTLLGWKGNNSLTTKKIIEVMTFRSNGTPVFGKFMFKKNKEKNYRMIFEYSSRTTMLLRFDNQMIHEITKPAKTIKQKYTSKNKKANKALRANKKIPAKIKTTKADMIVFDRLTPVDPRTSKYAADLEGQYQFYVPETNIFDGFIFENGKWVFVRDVDARNPKPKHNKKFREPQL